MPIQKKPILVIGATGNVGTQVVQQLLDTGANVRAAVRPNSKANFLKATGVDLVEVDFKKPETVKAGFEDVEKMFLLTPLVVNMVEIALQWVEAAKAANVQHIVRSSALGAGLNPQIIFGGWHRQVEKEIEASGCGYTFLRPTPFMQTYANSFGNTIKTTSSFSMILENSQISLVDTRDIASVAVATLLENGHQGKVYEITGREALTNYEVASILSRVIGKNIKYVPISDAQARQQMEAIGVPEILIDGLMELFNMQKAGHTAVISPVVEQITGRLPISFEQFARDYIEYFK